MGRHVFHSDNKAKYNKFKTIYEDWTIAAVMKNLNITKNQYHKFFTKAIAENRVESERPMRFKIHQKEAFSENEEDYGTKVMYPIRMHSVIGEVEPTELAIAIKNYKLQLKTINKDYGRDDEYVD